MVAAVLVTGSEMEAAHRLGLSHSTVKHHLANVRTKVGATTTAQLVWILAPRLPEPDGWPTRTTDRWLSDLLLIRRVEISRRCPVLSVRRVISPCARSWQARIVRAGGHGRGERPRRVRPRVDEILEHADEHREPLVTHDPVIAHLNLAYGAKRLDDGVATLSGRDDQLGAAVAWIWPSLEVTSALQVVHQLRHRGQGHVGSRRQFGQPGPVQVDRPEDLEVGFADVPIAALLGAMVELLAERAEQLSEKLADRQAGACVHAAIVLWLPY